MMTIIFSRNQHSIHEARLAGTTQCIAIQPRFFSRITGASLNAVAGIIPDCSVEMAAELGFTQFPVIKHEEVSA